MASTSAAERIAALDLPGNVFFGRVLTDAPARLSSGIAAVDQLIGGGWPRGRLSEVVGPPSSGRTGLLMACLAAATRRGEVVAYIDIADALDPNSLAQAKAELPRVLWVRPPSLPEAMRCSELILQAGGFTTVAIDFGADPPRRLRALVWPRLSHAAERARSVVLVAAPYRVAGSFSAISVSVRTQRACWSLGQPLLFDGLTTTATLTRSKLGQPGARIGLRLQPDPLG